MIHKADCITRIHDLVNDLIATGNEPGPVVLALGHAMLSTAQKDPENETVFLNAVSQIIQAKLRGKNSGNE